MKGLRDFHEKKVEEKKKWSQDVDMKWDAPEGFFKQSAEKIAAGLKKASDDLKQATSRLTFYINRAGKNLSAEDKKRLEAAKEKLKALYSKTESKVIPEFFKKGSKLLMEGAQGKNKAQILEIKKQDFMNTINLAEYFDNVYMYEYSRDTNYNCSSIGDSGNRINLSTPEFEKSEDGKLTFKDGINILEACLDDFERISLFVDSQPMGVPRTDGTKLYNASFYLTSENFKKTGKSRSVNGSMVVAIPGTVTASV